MDIIKKEIPALVKIASHVLGKPSEFLEDVVKSEITFLEQRLLTNDKLKECSGESLLMCVRHAIRDNLSIDENAGLVYIYPQRVKTGKDGNGRNIYTTVAKYEHSPNGKISLARQTGNILDHKLPELIKNNTKVVGGFIEILKPSYPNPRWEKVSFDLSDIERWKKYSAKKNSQWVNGPNGKERVPGDPNPLYVSGPEGGIDEGFMKAKIVKHSLKNLGINVSEVRNGTINHLTDDFTPPLNKEQIDQVFNEEIQVEEAEIIENENKEDDMPL